MVTSAGSQEDVHTAALNLTAHHEQELSTDLSLGESLVSSPRHLRVWQTQKGQDPSSRSFLTLGSTCGHCTLLQDPKNTQAMWEGLSGCRFWGCHHLVGCSEATDPFLLGWHSTASSCQSDCGVAASSSEGNRSVPAHQTPKPSRCRIENPWELLTKGSVRLYLS